MNSFGQKIRKLREKAGLPLRKVAAFMDIDQGILSKIERGQRKASRDLVLRFAEYFNREEKELLVLWLSDKVLYEIGDEKLGIEALRVAEEEIEYRIFKSLDRDVLIKKLKQTIQKFPNIEKAWIYGSFARGDDTPKSDVDITFKTKSGFSYFDLGGVKHELEESIGRKVDVGFIDSFKDYIWEHVKPDLKLIYEKR